MSYSSGFSWGTRNLNKDIKEEADSLSTSGSRLKSAKRIGASIGGLFIGSFFNCKNPFSEYGSLLKKSIPD